MLKEMRYPNRMDHFEALLRKIECLKSEIAEIKLLNERYQLGSAVEPEARATHLQRHERLQQIQKELVQLSTLGNKTISIDRKVEQHFSRRYPLKRAS
jgi:hypothetical protein